MWELVEWEFLNLCTDDPYPAHRAAFTGAVTTVLPGQGPPLSGSGSRLAILVPQGSDPTPPYPTLVIRQSATLSDGFAPGRCFDVVRPPARMAAMRDSLPLTAVIVSA